jgi:hypothetical protein
MVGYRKRERGEIKWGGSERDYIKGGIGTAYDRNFLISFYFFIYDAVRGALSDQQTYL